MRDPTRVFSQLVALAGSPVIVYSVIDYLNTALAHTPTADDIADEIVKRRERVKRLAALRQVA